MVLLRYAYVLALTLWLGGMIALGAVVAPALFSTLQTQDPQTGRALAGAAFGAILSRFHYIAYAAGGLLVVTMTAMAILGPRPRSFAVRTGIAAVMLGVALYSGFIVLGEIDGIQREVAAAAPGSALVLPSSLAAADPRRIRFNDLHQLSTRLMMFNILGALVLLFWEAREPAR
jgi:hypothetical protein